MGKSQKIPKFLLTPVRDRRQKCQKMKETSRERWPALKVRFTEQLHPYMFPKWQKVSLLQNRIFQSEIVLIERNFDQRENDTVGKVVEQIGHATLLYTAILRMLFC